MSFLGWLALSGVVLLIVAFSSSALRRLPITTPIIYLALGVTLGPSGFGWIGIDLRRAWPWLERLTEVAVIISLFVGGLKMRAPVRAPPWRAAFLLAGPVMLASIAGVAAFAHLALGLGLAAALLLGAVLAPTDPVLASDVAVANASDRDLLRYGLSGEAGLNDGMAFPFVVLALAWEKEGGPGSWLGPWAAHRLLWGLTAGLAIGYLAGLGIGRLAIALRRGQGDDDDAAPNDLFALALIALAYVAAETAGAWGFLAAFAAGVGLRRAEVNAVKASPHPGVPVHVDVQSTEAAPASGLPSEDDVPHPPAEHLVPAGTATPEMDHPAVAAGVLVRDTLSFGGTAERLLEVTLIVLVGAGLVTHWDTRGVPVALVLFLVIRPTAVWLCLAGSPTSGVQRWLLGWFGIRGIGSLYYLLYAFRESGGSGPVRAIVDITVTVVALSILLHGASSGPLLHRYERSLAVPRARRS
jgi:NhaP-type Na+/H+ or K+/H+ antiporter